MRLRRQQGLTEFLAADRGGAQLADDDAGGQIGQHGRLLHLCSRGRGRGEHRDHGVSRTGDIEHLARARRQMDRRLLRQQQRHAALAAGNQQAPDPGLGHQPLTSTDDIFLAAARTDHGLEFSQVRCHQARTAVGEEVAALRIDDQHLAPLSGDFYLFSIICISRFF